jgi:hypothetical protein
VQHTAVLSDLDPLRKPVGVSIDNLSLAAMIELSLQCCTHSGGLAILVANPSDRRLDRP